jgi:hypothetical protein
MQQNQQGPQRQNNLLSLFRRRQPRMGTPSVSIPTRVNTQRTSANSSGTIKLYNQLINYLMENGINFPSGDILNGINNMLNGSVPPFIAIQNLYNKLIPYLMNYNVSIPSSVQQGIYTILNTWVIYQSQAQQRGVARTALNTGASVDYSNCINSLQNSGQASVCNVFNESLNTPNANYIDYFNTHT